MKYCYVIIFAILFSAPLIAQMRPGMPGGAQMNVGHFYGKLLDDSTAKPIDAATVQLVQNKMDTITRKKRDFILATVLSSKKGEFSLENLPVIGNFSLRISAIGYKSIDQKVAFELNMASAKNGDYSSMMNSVDKDLGNIKMRADDKVLQNVVVTSSKPLMQMNIDRKVYNVEKDLTAAGGTAVDVMKNVPSVNVDIDGNVSLRNAPPQIFIDGRPTTLSLDQIPADQIASVEIITNASAKFDASGGGAGILNIVLKKNRKSGYNGNVRASIDSRGRPGGGGDFNLRQNKINFFGAAMLGMPKSISTARTERTDFLNSKTAHLIQNNGPTFKGVFAYTRLGFDYFVDNRNTITLSGNLVKRRFTTRDNINLYRDTVNGSQFNFETGLRNASTVSKGYNYGSSIGYKHNFAKAGKELTADVNFTYMNNENTADYVSNFYDEFAQQKGLTSVERALSNGDTKFLTVQTDFVNPVSKSQKLEMGLRMSRRNFSSENNNYFKLPSGTYFLIPGVSVNYKFTDDVYAAYTTFSQQFKKFSYQAGLRVESSQYDGDFITKNQQFGNEYPLSLFPSLFVTYKVNSKQDLQVNYSRKINRPNFFQLIPFIDFTDSLNLSVGNPNLVPEFTNLIELGYAVQYGKGNSFLATAYGRLTNDLITRYQYRIPNPNPSKNDSVLITTFANATSSSTIGMELIGKNAITKFWDLTSNVNIFNTDLQAGNLPGTENNSRLSWFAKLNNTFKLPKKYTIQLTADYQARTILPQSSNRGGGGGGFFMGGGFGQTQSNAQGYINPVYGVDISLRKDFLKNNAASLTLSCNDIFRTRLSASYAESFYFIQDNERWRDPQVFRLNFNYRFGKFDVSLFKRKNVKGEIESMQNMQNGAAQ